MTSMAVEASKRVLIVDDNPDNILLLRTRLESRGYRVDSAEDGQVALEQVYLDPPDLVLLDVMMPRIDGMEVVRRIKNDRSLPFIPIILQTALDSTDDIVHGLNAGADDYITKPINFRELEARVKSLLRIQELQNDLAARERELSDANERLRTMARTDALTGLDNRRHLEQELRDLWKHAQRLHEPFSLVMCDIDHFKRVNDRFGHQVGDAVLKQFAELLRQSARDIDHVSRYGGEEFVLLLPGTVLDAAVTFAERVRQAVEAHTFTYDSGKSAPEALHPTMSAGVAAWPHPRVTNVDTLLKAADDALYVAKETGRNRIIRFDSKEFNDHTATRDDSR
jgi:diguanylate cyclase (GGDEF)-like protein